MKIKDIRVVEITLNPKPQTKPRSRDRENSYRLNRPIDRYKTDNSSHISGANWKRPACIVTAEDGTWGFGISLYGGPVSQIITDHFAPHLVGQNCMATEKMWDMMMRLSTAFGASGLASYAISAVDCALWDLKGKILNRPVYELLGGPQKEKIFCYASGSVM